MKIIDAQVHIWAANSPERPWPARAEPHDATAWLPLPEVEALPDIGELPQPDHRIRRRPAE
jgi:predicted TIM-barrel fold metal-dependent hydrolase